MKANLNLGQTWSEEVEIISITPQGSKYIIIYKSYVSINPQRFETYLLEDIELA